MAGAERKIGGGRTRGDSPKRHEVRSIVSSELDARLTAYKQDSERGINWIVRTAIDEFLKARNY